MGAETGVFLEYTARELGDLTFHKHVGWPSGRMCLPQSYISGPGLCAPFTARVEKRVFWQEG